MTVYVDDPKYSYGRMIMCHMCADSFEELHEMAERIGVDKKHFQCPTKGNASYPHYDICKTKRRIAIYNGAKAVSTREILQAAKRLRNILLEG